MIAVFSGTSDGQLIVKELLKKNKRVCCFNATKYGGTLYEEDKNLIVYSHMMDKEEIQEKLKFNNVSIIIDATHPYAEIISSNLIEISEMKKLKYIRFDRPKETSDLKFYNTYEDIILNLEKKEGNILLTIGSNNLHLFTSRLDVDRLYSRVLPTKNVMNKCNEIGLSPSRIIAIQGPFSVDMNYVMMKDYNIKYLVTKESGKAGGFEDKIKAASELAIEIFVLKRPMVNYPNSYYFVEDIMREIGEKS